MPTKDEDGNFIGLDDFSIFLYGDDACEYVLPGSIPEVSELSADPEEHDCLPPLETPPDMAWRLSEETAKRMMEFIDHEEKLAKTSIYEYLQKLCDDMGATVEERDPHRRMLRKRIRWNERNRRRRLKGLPEKQNPYPRAVAFTYVINLQPTGPINMKFELEGNDEL